LLVVVVVVAVPTSTLKYDDLKRHNKSNPAPAKNSKEKKKPPQKRPEGKKSPLLRVDRLRECSIDLGQVQLLLPLLYALPFLSRGAGDLP